MDTVIHGVSAEETLALARVRSIKGFYIHAAQYLFVVGVLAIANIFLYPRHYWFIWVRWAGAAGC